VLTCITTFVTLRDHTITALFVTVMLLNSASQCVVTCWVAKH